MKHRPTILWLGLALAGFLPSGVRAQEAGEETTETTAPAARGQAEEGSARAKRAAEKVKTWMGSWRSIEFVSERRHKHLGQEEPDRLTAHLYEHYYVETAAGQRYHDFRLHLSDGTTSRQTSYSTGKQCASVSYESGSDTRQSQVTVQSTFSSEANALSSLRPHPLTYFYVLLIPLHEALPDAEFVGEQNVLGRPCEAFLFRNRPQGRQTPTFRYVIDKQTGVPLALQTFKTEEHYEKNLPLLTWKATKFEERQGHPCVIEAEENLFDTSDPAKVRQTVSGTQVVKEIVFDKDYPKEVFRVQIQPGVRVNDGLKGTSYVTSDAPAEESNNETPR